MWSLWSDRGSAGSDRFTSVGGNATTFKKKENPVQFEQIYKYSRNAEALKKQGIEQMASAVNFNMITIQPLKIRYLDMRKGFRNVMWEK